MNKLTIAGIVEQTPVDKGNSGKVAEILISVPDRKKTASGSWEEVNLLIPITLFGKPMNEAKKHAVIGAKILVVGKIEGREYNGKYYTSVVAEDIFVGRDQAQEEAIPQDEPGQGRPSWDEIDDIPF